MTKQDEARDVANALDAYPVENPVIERAAALLREFAAHLEARQLVPSVLGGIASPAQPEAQPVADPMNELRRACAGIIGADPETWPEHGNAPLAIASALALARSEAQPAVAPVTHTDPLNDDAYLRGVALGFPQGDSRRWNLCRIADRIEAARIAELEADAGRFRKFARLMHGAVGAGIEVNDAALVYETPEPGEQVRLYWYPDTPVGFYEVKAATVEEAIDAVIDDAAIKGAGGATSATQAHRPRASPKSR